ncbi:C4b-binding protein alpha chain isoform X2 [Vombatus ursinus]|uniref:C4b-binding protein alpha chain isoform X2 n=1 Tax=Vombatus ursinus TaxID=29139 RepID=UPI000FFD43E6|nr:C4b-binding protein alpha chain isoform X2 [Vombatus ursinus]
MAYRREKWKGHGPTLFQIILSFALLARVHGFCDPPPKLVYAALVSPSEILNQTTFEDGTQLKYTCRQGYVRNSSRTTLTCRKNYWSPTTPFCVKKRCHHPGELNNGRVIINTDLEFGSKIEFSCSDGYNLIGSSTSWCDIFELGVTWSDPLPVCEIIICPPPPQISNGKHSSREDDIYSFGSSVTYRCNTPFSLIGEASISCTVVNGTIGTWSPHPPICKMVSCKQPQFLNGKLISGLGPIYTYKDTILLECNRGYLINGTNVIHCGADNRWHPDIPACMINACIEKPLIENADLLSHRRDEGVFSVGTVLTFACKRGYKAIPDISLTATCQEDFSWSMNEVLCKNCSSPKTIENANYTITTGLFSVSVEYSCKDGYVLIGKAKNTCQNSKWAHAFPYCQALCPKPKLLNGKLSSEKTHYRINESVNVQCSPGYYLLGPQTITCSENSLWIPEGPKCEWEFPEGCEKVSAIYKIMQCLPNAQDVKMALEIHKLTLEIEMLELEIGKKRDTNQSHHHHHVAHKREKDPETHFYD